MQKILSIDASISPAIAVLAEIREETVTVLQRAELPPEVGFDSRSWGKKRETMGAEGEKSGAESERTAETATSSPEPRPPLTSAGSTSRSDQSESAATKLFGGDFVNCLLIVPPEQFLSLSIELPFSDPKQIAKVVAPELQDSVPFETDEFLIQHRVMAERAPQRYEVHVSAIAKDLIKDALDACKSFGVDPIIVSTPASVLGSLIRAHHHPAPALYALYRAPYCHVALEVNGAIRSERVIDTSCSYTSSNTAQDLLRRLRMEVGSFERENGVTVQDVFLVGGSLLTGLTEDEASALVGRPTRSLDIRSVMGDQLVLDPRFVSGGGGTSLNGAGLATLGAFYAADEHTSKVLTNFRTREFAYQPPLKELWQASKSIAPYLGVTLLLCIVFFVVRFLTVEHTIAKLNQEMAAQIRQVLANESIPEGEELKFLAGETARIDDELKNLGSPSLVSPLAALADLSEAFPEQSEVQINKVAIAGNQILVDGCTPKFAAVEKLEKQLRESKIFSRVDRRTSQACMPGRQTGSGFTLTIGMKEQQ